MWIDEENVISKKLEFYRQNNPQSLKSTFTSRFKCGLKSKDGFNRLAFNEPNICMDV